MSGSAGGFVVCGSATNSRNKSGAMLSDPPQWHPPMIGAGRVNEAVYYWCASSLVLPAAQEPGTTKCGANNATTGLELICLHMEDSNAE
jgi:hypothetical protein